MYLNKKNYLFRKIEELITSISQSLKELSPKNRINYYNSFESLGIKIEKIYEDMYYNYFFFHIYFMEL